MSVHAPPTLCPNDSMIDISSSSFEPMTRYTVPVPSPAADAMSRIVVISYPRRPNSARATARTWAAFSSPSSSSSTPRLDDGVGGGERLRAVQRGIGAFIARESVEVDSAQHRRDLVGWRPCAE